MPLIESGLFDNKPGGGSGFFVISSSRSVRGFTLTELIVTIVVAGILAAVFVPRFDGEHGFEGRGFRDETAAALRYAQKSAIASRRMVCVTFTATTVQATVATAAGTANCAGGAALQGPRGSALTVTATGNAQFSTFPVGGLTFNALGQPGGAATISVQGLPAALAINVEAETGHVR